MSKEYIFQNAADQNEYARLGKLEEACDPFTKAFLDQLGVGEGNSCLEVGAGAGSIMRELCERVGPAGQVTAIDLNTRFIAEESYSNLKVIQGNIETVPLEAGSFDFIHARYVLIHIHEYQAVISKLAKALKPGGWILLEEPDFSPAKPPMGVPEYVASFYRVRDAISRMYEAKQLDPRFGAKLKRLLQELSLVETGNQYKAEVACGGSPLAEMMKISTRHLAETYLQTGAVTKTDIEIYCRMTEDFSHAAVYYATVAAWGKKAV